MSMDWFRFHHGTSTDPKFRIVAKKCMISISSVLGVWSSLLEMASVSENRGEFSIDFEVFDCQLDIENSKLIIDSMVKLNMLDDVTTCNASVTQQNVTYRYSVKNWEKRQPKREREDDSKERVKAYRERQKQNVTPCNAEKRLDKIRLDNIKEKNTSYSKEKIEKTFLPNDWFLPKAWGEWAISERAEATSQEIKMVADNFKAYWLEQTGVKGKKTDWYKTWQTWIRNESRIIGREKIKEKISGRKSYQEKNEEMSKKIYSGLHDRFNKFQQSIQNLDENDLIQSSEGVLNAEYTKI